MVEGCSGYFVEIISEEVSKHDTEDFIFMDEPRLYINEDIRKSVPDNYDTVVKVSRATSDIEAMIKFYTEITPGTVVKREKKEDGTEIAVVKFNGGAEIYAQFV